MPDDEIPTSLYELRVLAKGPHATDPAHRGPGEAVHSFMDFLVRLGEHGHEIVAAHVIHHPATAQQRVEVLAEPPAVSSATSVDGPQLLADMPALAVPPAAADDVPPAPGAEHSGV